MSNSFMTWTLISDKNQFMELAHSVCKSQEAKYSLLYGMALNLEKYGSHYMLAFNDEAVALQTNPHKAMVVTDLSIHAASELAKWLEAHNDVKEIVGSKETINQILDQSRSIHPGFPELIMDQRIYELKELKLPHKIRGKMVEASEVHLKLVSEWFYDFMIDAYVNPDVSREKMMELAKARIDNNEVFLFLLDGHPVSMACSSRPTNQCISVNGVFTPIAHRGNGYASEIVYLISEELLKKYKTTCLYTDLANNTSNKIYQNVGYTPLCDSLHYQIKP